jgi:hypothetical protein
MKVVSMSVEQCINQIYIYGIGSMGIGPAIDIDQCSTEARISRSPAPPRRLWRRRAETSV